MPAYSDSYRPRRRPPSSPRARARAREAQRAEQVTVLFLGALALLGFLLTM